MTIPTMPPLTLMKHRLGQKLQQHMQPSGADRHPQSDLARPLGHRDEQDIHDADAADDKRYGGHRGQKKRHDAAAALGGLGDLAEISHREIVGGARPDAVAAGQDFGGLADRRLNGAPDPPPARRSD